MIKNIKKVVILGGGSAGWMSAAAFVKTFPDLDISVIESPNIPIVGVGESTLGGIRMFTHYLGIKEKDFMSYTDGSYKLSIKFTDFYEKDSGSFHYPFGNPQVDGSYQGLRDWMYKKVYEGETPLQDFVRSYFPAAALFESNKFSTNSHGKFDNFNLNLDVAYHFDATKFGSWLRQEYALPRGVKQIVGTVTDVVTNEEGIKELVLDSGVSIGADLFVDCTGFKSMLLEESLKVPFISYADMLPNNRAWACQVPYVDQEKELEGFTNCTAIDNGWCWNIPLWSRLGTGYVYSDKHTTPEEALEQYKNYLCSNKMIIPRTREQVDSYKFNDIKFRTGIHQQTFVKNVVAIGLSAGFIEPLESNGLFSVHEFLFKLMKTLKNKSVTQWDRDCYNTSVYGLYQNFAEFVALHYALSNRNDTQYWKDNANRVYDRGLDQLTPTMNVGFHNFVHRSMFTGEVDSKQGITYISVGMNRPMLDNLHVKLAEIETNTNLKSLLIPYFVRLETNRERWKKQAEVEPTLFEYLKKNIHGK